MVGDLDAGKVKVGSAIAAVSVVVAIQGAAFHQILSIRDEVNSVKTTVAVNTTQNTHVQESLREIKDRLQGVLTREAVQGIVQQSLRASRVLSEEEIDKHIRDHAPYLEDRAMLIQRLDGLEKRIHRLEERIE